MVDCKKKNVYLMADWKYDWYDYRYIICLYIINMIINMTIYIINMTIDYKITDLIAVYKKGLFMVD